MLKQQIYNIIENIDIDIEELNSYRRVKDPYCVGADLYFESEYDEEEAFEAKTEKFLKCLEYGDLIEWLDLPENIIENEMNTMRLTNAVKRWIETGDFK